MRGDWKGLLPSIRSVAIACPVAMAMTGIWLAEAATTENKARLRFLLPERVYFIDVRIGDATGAQQEIPFILDTGASYSVVHPLDLENVKLVHLRDETIFLPDGSSHPLGMYQAPELTVGGCRLQNVKMLVGDIAAANFLGVNVLTRLMPFTVTPETISFRCPEQNNQQSLNKGNQP